SVWVWSLDSSSSTSSITRNWAPPMRISAPLPVSDVYLRRLTLLPSGQEAPAAYRFLRGFLSERRSNVKRLRRTVLAGGFAALSLLVAGGSAQTVRKGNFVSPEQLDLASILPNPPSDNSPQGKAELAQVHRRRKRAHPPRSLM